MPPNKISPKKSASRLRVSRREFQKLGLAASALPTLSCATRLTHSTAPSLIGCASGDVTESGVMLWTRADQPARIWIEISRDPNFSQAVTRIDAGVVESETDFNLTQWIDGLSPDTEWHYRVRAESPSTPGHFSAPLLGKFRTAQSTQPDEGNLSSLCFCWAGDTAGQGWGAAPLDTNGASENLNPGMKTYAAMLEHEPQFFVHSGDQIYADGPMQKEITLDDGQSWKNLVTPAKTKVAETLQDFRENYYYNYLDAHLRHFHAQVPLYYQWDDHEVINNWYPGEIREDDRYQEQNISMLAARAKRAMFECNPIRLQPGGSRRVYRVVHRGPLLDLFFLDLRSYRGPNSLNRQTSMSEATQFLGADQLEWLKTALANSKATWKIICSDMPLSELVTDWGTSIAENGANGDDGAPLGRELELASLFSFVKQRGIENLHFLTADVHYCASNHYHPDRAGFTDFNPFWEHISGPLHAGTFAPLKQDSTFGPERVFCGVPQDLAPNQPPSEPYQFFGKVEIDGATRDLKVSHYNSENRLLWSREFSPGEA